MYGESHHIVIAAVDFFHGYASDPFLDSVGTRLVEWHEIVDVIAGFFRRDLSESHFCHGREAGAAVSGGDAHPATYFMGLVREGEEHFHSLFAGLGFA